MFFYTLSKKQESRRQDLNLRHLGPKPSTLPNWVTPRWDTSQTVSAVVSAKFLSSDSLYIILHTLGFVKRIFAICDKSQKSFVLQILFEHYHHTEPFSAAFFCKKPAQVKINVGKCLQNGRKLAYQIAFFVHMYNIMYKTREISWFLNPCVLLYIVHKCIHYINIQRRRYQWPSQVLTLWS